MESKNKTFRLPNGLVILFEEMSWSNTFALAITVPAGSVFDPPNAEGLAALTCEMTNRGAGKYNNRSFLEALEKYGAVKGSFLAIKRILRCNPFCKGGYDPVP